LHLARRWSGRALEKFRRQAGVKRILLLTDGVSETGLRLLPGGRAAKITLSSIALGGC
jgi:hypothetical protein